MDTVKNRCVIMPIDHTHLCKLISKTKTMELRRAAIRLGTQYILFYENETNLITASAFIERCFWETPKKIWELHKKRIGITEEELFKYAGANNCLFCIRTWIYAVLKNPITLDEVNLSSAPQSYVYRELEHSRISDS